MSDPLVWASAGELARRVSAREISPVEIAEAHLERIAALDAHLRAYIAVTAEAALAAARAVEAALAAGEPVGPLAGVPVGLKDLFETAGVATTAGSRILEQHVPTADATVVERLRGAGAMVLGKLTMHEFAYGPEGLSERWGHARNPWDARTHRVAGGSSSGSGVAVAAGLATGALGSDTGGSIRIPASLCGITGLKPTYGRVSRAGVLPLSWSLDHAGPMARSAADCALFLGVLAGYDPRDPTTSVLPVPDYTAALGGEVRGLRIGLVGPGFLDAAEPAVRDAVRAAARLLEAEGAIVDEVALPSVADVPAASFAVLATEALVWHAEWLRTRPGDYQRDVRERLELGAFVSGVDYLRGQQARVLVRREVDAALARRDVLLAPATPIPAPPLGAATVPGAAGTVEVRSSLIRFTRPFNMSGHPACSLPCGSTPEGLPLGMQLIGRPFDEATVLRVADAYQRRTAWHQRRPELAPLLSPELDVAGAGSSARPPRGSV